MATRGTGYQVFRVRAVARGPPWEQMEDRMHARKHKPAHPTGNCIMRHYDHLYEHESFFFEAENWAAGSWHASNSDPNFLSKPVLFVLSNLQLFFGIFSPSQLSPDANPAYAGHPSSLFHDKHRTTISMLPLVVLDEVNEPRISPPDDTLTFS